MFDQYEGTLKCLANCNSYPNAISCMRARAIEEYARAPYRGRHLSLTWKACFAGQPVRAERKLKPHWPMLTTSTSA
jgi:hypothetical protein